MTLLERLGLARKTPPPVGQTLERKGRDPKDSRRQNLAVKAGIFVGLLVLAMLVYPSEPLYEYNQRVDDIWQADDLIAPFAFSIAKDPDSLAAEREAEARAVPPLFREHPTAEVDIQRNAVRLRRQLDSLFTAYTEWQLALKRGQTARATSFSQRFAAWQDTLNLSVAEDVFERMLAAHAASVEGLTANSRSTEDRVPIDALVTQARSAALGMLQVQPTLDVPKDSIFTPEIYVLDSDQTRLERRRELQDVQGKQEIRTAAGIQFENIYRQEPDWARLAEGFFDNLFVASLQLERSVTEQRRAEARAAVSERRGVVQAGEIIVRRGDRITSDSRLKLASLTEAWRAKSGNEVVWKSLLGRFIPTLATFIIFFLYLYLLRRQIFDRNQDVLLIALLMGFIIVCFGVVVRLPDVSSLVVPVLIVSILLTVIYDSRVGMFATIALSLLGGMVFNYDFEFTFATIFVGSLAIFSVRDIKTRSQFFSSPGISFAGYLAIVGAFSLLNLAPVEEFGRDVLFIAINAVLILFSYFILWAFERLFGVTTDLTLLELSDTNRPLLKELSMTAPGTFNHSLQVANLAEAAAAAIGANALLARVGALYHDIGKMKKPEYFIENQRPGENPHDRLSPHMSATVVASHVRDGMHMAERHKLPSTVVEFIPTHHGSSLIEYFYRRAEQQASPEDPPISEAEFRYPGPRPDTNEQGILMLADSVEAACRSIAKPTPKRLEGLIEAIFKSRVEDGQLDGCPLTFADLRKIKETFLQSLAAIYHIRVKYPDQDDEEPSDERDIEAVAASERKREAGLSKPPADAPPVEVSEGHVIVGPPEADTSVEEDVLYNREGGNRAASHGDGAPPTDEEAAARPEQDGG